MEREAPLYKERRSIATPQMGQTALPGIKNKKEPSTACKLLVWEVAL
jgi:hypothetical protein